MLTIGRRARARGVEIQVRVHFCLYVRSISHVDDGNWNFTIVRRDLLLLVLVCGKAWQPVFVDPVRRCQAGIVASSCCWYAGVDHRAVVDAVRERHLRGHGWRHGRGGDVVDGGAGGEVGSVLLLV